MNQQRALIAMATGSRRIWEAGDAFLKNILAHARGECLTVLCYHRVCSNNDEGFQGYLPNISVSAREFEAQMELVKSLFSPVSVQDVVLWLTEGYPLPKRPVLVTFDDGYRDNGYIAWPIMRQLGIPAVIFLSTTHIGNKVPFLCDFVAYCFRFTARRSVSDPLIGQRELVSSAERNKASSDWVGASKNLPGERRWPAAQALASNLGVSPPIEAFAKLCLTWDEVRQLKSEGLCFGGHTQTHPILARLAASEAQVEIYGCQEKLADELGSPALAFAYPNGGRNDYTFEHEELVRACGFKVAFTLEHGPASFEEIRRRPMAIRRIYVGPQDRRTRLAAKALGGARLAVLLRSCLERSNGFVGAPRR